jgi:hypothetical protein
LRPSRWTSARGTMGWPRWPMPSWALRARRG